MTHFFGHAHMLSRKIVGEFDISSDGCVIVNYEQYIQVYSSGYDFQSAFIRNPLTREDRTAPFNEEGRMHLTVSLLIGCSGEIINGEYGRKVLRDYSKMPRQSYELAGGSIVSVRDPQFFHVPGDEK